MNAAIAAVLNTFYFALETLLYFLYGLAEKRKQIHLFISLK